MVTAGCTGSGDGNSNEDRSIGESSGDSELGEDGGSGEELDTSMVNLIETIVVVDPVSPQCHCNLRTGVTKVTS